MCNVCGSKLILMFGDKQYCGRCFYDGFSNAENFDFNKYRDVIKGLSKEAKG